MLKGGGANSTKKREKKFGKTLKSLVFAAKCLQSSHSFLLLILPNQMIDFLSSFNFQAL